jgi:hypothetical protein
MALKKTAIARIAGLLKIDQAKLGAAIAAQDEQDVAIADDLQSMNKAELDTRDRNQYNEGKKAGSDMAMKEIKTKAGIEIEGVDPEKIATAISTKAVETAKVAPDEQVKAAQRLTDQWKEKAKTAEEQLVTLKSANEQLAMDNRYRALLPKDRSDLLNDDEYLMSTKVRFEIKKEGDKEVVVDRTTGEIVRNKTDLQPIAPGDVFKAHFTERKWIAEPPTDPKKGPGSGNSGPAGGKGQFKKMSEAKKYAEGNGINLQGSAGQAYLRGVMKDNPDIDVNQ